MGRKHRLRNELEARARTFWYDFNNSVEKEIREDYANLEKKC